mgnify:CR=1 FL=1
MKKFFLFTFCFTLSVAILKAQHIVKAADNFLSLKVGHQKNYLKDNILSPLHYQGAGMQYGLSYRRIGENIFGISVGYGAGEVSSNETSGFIKILKSCGMTSISITAFLR